MAPKKQTHRQILAYWEQYILNRNLGISPYGNECFHFVDGVLRAYAVKEQQEADAKKDAARTLQNAPESTEEGSKVVGVIAGGEA